MHRRKLHYQYILEDWCDVSAFRFSGVGFKASQASLHRTSERSFILSEDCLSNVTVSRIPLPKLLMPDKAPSHGP